ncbi:1-phosphofructokinase [Ralstonia nicotianae]|uniref:1-phosphofructokinase n=1 Tax=Ralstonia solanacearum species complex TaxID=3116862 RepID=UPI0002F1E54D|nr:1-phosphofructokinase [Ralstonia pseudosolanacearum]AOE90712.1 1-phosphofructokinase [Ralstonia solanacearum]APF85886.1 1-phosphofructokinase [Ralstonia solanacearum FJAT-1458]ARS57191.1 1-phosphofructokinase [Ralstonia solanacearum FJAT-91]ESS49045.1 1-phosphofructokinase [Ralstonia solanacearum SD54]AXV68354.1 1-phosphofructokinase [Ralstonia solanacearum]
MTQRIVTVTLNPAIDMTVGLDRLERGHVNLGRSVTHQAGGKGVNVAGCLADWQVPVVATGLLGEANTELFEALFARKGVADSFCRVPGTNRTNIKISDQSDGQTTDINLPGITAAPADLDAVCERVDAVADVAGIALCGSLAGGLPADTYVRLLARLNRRGARTLLDTSGAPLTHALAAPREALPTAIKPNRHELELWAGRPLPALQDVVDAARGIHARGVAQVIVSLGEQGALFVTGEGIWQASLPPVRAASTVGAGDAMVAGVLAGWHAGASTEETVRLSVAFAACKLQRIGPHLPPPQQVRERAAAVHMQRVA